MVERFPDRVLWGTDWPHPNMTTHMPDDGVLVDMIPQIRARPRRSEGAAGRQSDAALLGEVSDGDDEANPYDDIPGTIVFDAKQSRAGYHLNMFCMSLMTAENRNAFKADEAAYLDRFPADGGAAQGGAGAQLERDARSSAATSITPPSSPPPTA